LLISEIDFNGLSCCYPKFLEIWKLCCACAAEVFTAVSESGKVTELEFSGGRVSVFCLPQNLSSSGGMKSYFGFNLEIMGLI